MTTNIDYNDIAIARFDHEIITSDLLSVIQTTILAPFGVDVLDEDEFDIDNNGLGCLVSIDSDNGIDLQIVAMNKPFDLLPGFTKIDHKSYVKWHVSGGINHELFEKTLELFRGAIDCVDLWVLTVDGEFKLWATQ